MSGRHSPNWDSTSSGSPVHVVGPENRTSIFNFTSGRDRQSSEAEIERLRKELRDCHQSLDGSRARTPERARRKERSPADDLHFEDDKVNLGHQEELLEKRRSELKTKEKELQQRIQKTDLEWDLIKTLQSEIRNLERDKEGTVSARKTWIFIAIIFSLSSVALVIFIFKTRFDRVSYLSEKGEDGDEDDGGWFVGLICVTVVFSIAGIICSYKYGSFCQQSGLANFRKYATLFRNVESEKSILQTKINADNMLYRLLLSFPVVIISFLVLILSVSLTFVSSSSSSEETDSDIAKKLHSQEHQAKVSASISGIILFGFIFFILSPLQKTSREKSDNKDQTNKQGSPRKKADGHLR